MRLRELVREAWLSTVTRLAPSIAVVLLAAAMCLTTLVTVGRTAAAESQVAARLDSAGARLIVLTDARQQGLLPPEIVQLTAALNTVEGAVGLTSPVDVVSGRVGEGGIRIPAWQVIGGLDQAVALTSGRWPQPGEVIVADAAVPELGLDGPAGYVTGGDTEWAVVGTYTARDAFPQLDAGAVGPARDPGEVASTLHVVVGSTAQASATQAAVLALVAPPQTQDVTVQSPVTLAELQAQIGADVGAYGYSLTVLVLGAGAGLVAVVVLIDVLVRRADLGRRRALGATRGVIVSLVVLRTAFAAAAGVIVGEIAGALASDAIGLRAPLDFSIALGTLALLSALLAAVPFAIAAAMQDPVRVLRIP